MKNSTAPQRCPWAGIDPLTVAYHDREWGVPVHNDRHLFEMLILEGAQAGLSWSTILKKRKHYRKVFDRFDPKKVAQYDAKKIAALLADGGIVRNRLKIHAAVANARAFLAVQREFGSFDDYIWQFVEGKPLVNRWKAMKELPARTRESDAMSKDLQRRGFSFVGSTICYAFMQATGMVNDHLTRCVRFGQLKEGIMKTRRASQDLTSVPGVGPSIAEDLRELGIRGLRDLKGRSPEQLYEQLCEVRNTRIDPCVLYVFRCAVYYATVKRPRADLLKWWNWKDRPSFRASTR